MRRKPLLIKLVPLLLLAMAMSLYLMEQGQHLLNAFDQEQEELADPITRTSPDLDLIVSLSAKVPVVSPTSSSAISVSNGNILSEDEISPFITAILDPSATEPPRLQCPDLETQRYEILTHPQPKHVGLHQIDYYFVLDLRNCLGLLPRLIGSIVSIRFLGVDRCALSIVEGNSPDGTGDVLQALTPYLADLNISYSLQSSTTDPASGDRIRKLAELRNLAMQPIFDAPERVSDNTTIVFINDVAACVHDLLELVLQRRLLGADMTCAMDWTYIGPYPTFYDVWVARTIQGDSFFKIPLDGSWDSAWDLFWNDPSTHARFLRRLPFQVFSCWNGATAFGAAPVLDGLRFRNPREGECAQGEPQLFCKDLWYRGYRKIAVVPTVNLEYSDDAAAKLKRLKGWTSELVRGQSSEENMIDWSLEPPEQVKCMPSWGHQFWQAWNETLGDKS